MAKQQSIDPATGNVAFEIEEHSPAEVEGRVALAASAAVAWAASAVNDRAELLFRAADLLEAEREDFGRLMTQEMGKTLASAIAEAEKCAAACRYYADNAARFLDPELVVDHGSEHGEVCYQPLGTVLAVMPWNFPFWQVIRFAAPAIAAGNTALLKHASNVPRSAIALEDLFRRAGAPPGVFQSLLIPARRVADLIADPRVHAVTLTGSEPAGRSVAEAAGRHLKKAVLELGGSDPFIVCESADLDRAAAVAVTARCINNGQSCIAAKRFIVVAPVFDRFLDRFTALMSTLRVGDPMDPDTDLGPLATPAIRDELDAQVTASLDAGARRTLGSGPIPGRGNYYSPTILVDVPRSAPAWSEELFGPVALFHRVASLDAAIELANATRFGLGASVWTAKIADARRAELGLDCGTVFVNGMVASDPRFPFGGVKASGFGRELGVWGLREFVNVKTVRRFGLER
ncbi:MAG: NAD-dependent succinate-semialdehyde dehydrogenase [Gemmatimonadaceae bacterium]|nr:NAD-dependent succinate-semialdehyde dehydrogenase [Gemmatimonadaceae bacterium]